MKRLISVLLCAVMLCAMVPAMSLTAFAADDTYVNIVQSRINSYRFSSMPDYQKDNCRGILYDIDQNGQKEMILLRYESQTWEYEIWTIRNGATSRLLKRTFRYECTSEPTVSVTTYGGVRYLVLETMSGGSIGGYHKWELYRVSASSYTMSFDMARQEYWGSSTTSDHSVNGSLVSESQFNQRYKYLTNEKTILTYDYGKRWDEFLKDLKFRDISSGAWYYTAVRYVADRGFMTGYDSGYFGPSDKLQRQDFVVTLARLASVDLTAYQGRNGGLSDVKAAAYYGPAVAWAVEQGIITGYQNGKFGVGDTITREQVCTILWRYMGSPSVSNANSVLAGYPDRGNVSAFAKTAVAWAVKNGIITGDNGKLSPTVGTSRATIATIIMRMDQNGYF